MASESECLRAVSEGKTARVTYVGGTLVTRGRVVSYTRDPQVCIETDSGERVWWLARLVEIEDPRLLDPSGEPYPEEVQEFFDEWQPSEQWRLRLTAALEAVRQGDREQQIQNVLNALALAPEDREAEIRAALGDSRG